MARAAAPVSPVRRRPPVWIAAARFPAARFAAGGFATTGFTTARLATAGLAATGLAATGLAVATRFTWSATGVDGETGCSQASGAEGERSQLGPASERKAIVCV